MNKFDTQFYIKSNTDTSPVLVTIWFQQDLQ